jgi:hypothetical protein
MQKLKHIKYTKLSPILSETVPSQWSRHSVSRQNPRGIELAIYHLLVCFDSFIGSRHLVFN